MMNVQWMDPAHWTRRTTPIETEAGRPLAAWSIRNWMLTRFRWLRPSMVPRYYGFRCRGFMEPIINADARRLP